MNRFFTILFGTMCSMAAVAQPQFHASDTQQQLGDIMFQTPKTVSFEVTNKGNQPLEITNVLPSCGCVQVTYPSAPIKAGATAKILAVYDAGMLGTFHREIAVYSNAGEEPVYLGFNGRVVDNPGSVDYSQEFPVDMGNVRLNTASVEFDDVNKGDKPVAEILVANTEKTTYRPQLMHLPNYLQAEYIPQEIRGGRIGTIRLTLDSEKLMMSGLNQTSLYLARKTGDKVSNENEIVVSSVLLPSFANLTESQLARAPRIVLMDGEEMVMGDVGMVSETRKNRLVFISKMVNNKQSKQTKLTKNIKITNIGEDELNISALQVFNRAISVSLGNRVVPAHGTTNLKVTIDLKQLEKAKNEPRILIICNDPRHAKTVLNINVEQGDGTSGK